MQICISSPSEEIYLNREKEETRRTVKRLIRNRTFCLAILIAIAVPSVASAFLSVQLVYAAAGSAAQVQVPVELYSQYGMGCSQQQ